MLSKSRDPALANAITVSIDRFRLKARIRESVGEIADTAAPVTGPAAATAC
ncbi:MAG: hypothetical protein HC850_08150 [Rhodomicrobium sp.]|nr:hypothetical protein [Rhodomicrobium sp.]